MSAAGRVRRVGILGHTGRAAVRDVVPGLRRWLVRRGCDVQIEQGLARTLGEDGAPLTSIAARCQILLTLGGDGTALVGGRALIGKRGILLPVNFGGLGFLTIAEASEIESALTSATTRAWRAAPRGVVRAQVARGGRVVRRGAAMNDAVIKGAGGVSAVHLRLDALGQSLGLLVADGLIVATAAGSTAYSLSAGGPLLAPELEAIVVTPVCAHSLGSRTMVLPPDADVHVRVIGSQDRCVLLFDGQERIDLEPKDQVRARYQRAAVRVFENPERPFGRSLRVKLGWQGSARRSM